jgi:uncharacterized protein YyaL (SSP411 family)
MSNRYSDQDRREENPNCLRFLRNGLTGWIKITVVLGVIFAFWMTDWAIGPGALSETEQKGASGAPVAGNQLAHEASPYLREAALEPIQWFPWGDAAFRRAQQEDKPVLLDIGAIWCHWCHVMDVENYDNEEVAFLINQHFVAIKVDMDERPDIDRRYQLAVQAISGSGGWPLTAFLTPEGKVFYGGTYFPREDRFFRPGFKTLLQKLAQAYKTRKAGVLADAEQLSGALQRYAAESTKPGSISDSLVQSISIDITKSFDAVNGGFSTEVKFPAASAVEFALAKYFVSHDPKLLEIANKTLDAMAQGGVYDQLGGGFFRYATDPQWRIPHFEKMNYDNAELLRNYLHAYQATGKPLYREIAEGVMEYLNGVLSDQVNGGFFAHQDADMTRQDDGDYYTWTVQEVKDALSKEEAEVILRYYDIGPLGEMKENPGKNVLYVAMPPEAIARDLGSPVEKVRSLIDQAKRRLLQARMKRKTPLVDKTLYIDRNAMLISAYLEAAEVLGNDQAKTFALKTLELLLRKAYREGQGMSHAYFEGTARLPGLLNDQVQMANALLDAFEVTGEQRYLMLAKDLMDLALSLLWDSKEGGFFDRPRQGAALAALERPLKNIEDNPTASPNGMAALVLDRLAYLTNNEAYEQKALQTLQAFAGSVKGAGHFVATYALAVHYHINRSAQAVIIGKKSHPKMQLLWKSALMTYRPGKMVAVYDPTELKVKDLPPAVAGAVKAFGVQGEPRAYICAGSTCAPPTGDPNEVVTLVKTYGLEKS